MPDVGLERTKGVMETGTAFPAVVKPTVPVADDMKTSNMFGGSQVPKVL